MCIHGIPLSNVLDRGSQFTYRFWRSFKKGLGTKVKCSTAFHPQIDGQAEHISQTLKDMLRLELLILRVILIIICLWWSSVIIISFIHPSPWIPMKLCMLGGIGLLLGG